MGLHDTNGMKDRDDNVTVDKDIRCDCGRMVARIEGQGIVIKCNRCGKFVVIPLATIREMVKAHEAPR